MPTEVIVKWSATQEFRLDGAGADPMDAEAARRWLDAEFTRLDCEPLRASGKVLLADKVLVVAQAAGAALLQDRAWSASFACATVAALGRSLVRVDVVAMAVTF